MPISSTWFLAPSWVTQLRIGENAAAEHTKTDGKSIDTEW